MADIGRYTLESGELLEACQIGHCTFRELNVANSNAALFLVWLMGTSVSVDFLIGKERNYKQENTEY